jgi:cell division protein FtsB
MNRKQSPKPPRQRKAPAGTAWMRRLRDSLTACIQVPLKRSGTHIVALVMLLLMLSLVIHFVNQVLQSAHLEAERAALATEVAQLEAENQQLLGAVEYVESDLYVERVAREELGYAREGETVVLPRFVEPTPTPLPATPAVPLLPSPTPQPNWQGWWESFFPEGHTEP